MSDHAAFGKIMGMDIQRIQDSPLAGNINGIGSVRLLKLPFFPFEETVRKSEKPTCIEYQISKGTPLHHHYGILLFKAIEGNKTALTYTIELGSRIPLVGLIVKTVLQNSLKSGLKKYADQLKNNSW